MESASIVCFKAVYASASGSVSPPSSVKESRLRYNVFYCTQTIPEPSPAQPLWLVLSEFPLAAEHERCLGATQEGYRRRRSPHPASRPPLLCLRPATRALSLPAQGHRQRCGPPSQPLTVSTTSFLMLLPGYRHTQREKHTFPMAAAVVAATPSWGREEPKPPASGCLSRCPAPGGEEGSCKRREKGGLLPPKELEPVKAVPLNVP